MYWVLLKDGPPAWSLMKQFANNLPGSLPGQIHSVWVFAMGVSWWHWLVGWERLQLEKKNRIFSWNITILKDSNADGALWKSKSQRPLCWKIWKVCNGFVGLRFVVAALYQLMNAIECFLVWFLFRKGYYGRIYSGSRFGKWIDVLHFDHISWIS